MMSRREFNGLCITVGSSLGMVGGMLAVPSGALALDAGTGVVPTGAGRMVKFRDGVVAPALGQGSAQLAVGRRPQAVEEEALRTGLSLGMTLIDTAEMYGDGRSEKFIGRVIAGQRDRVFLVSKVSPSHATEAGIPRESRHGRKFRGLQRNSLRNRTGNYFGGTGNFGAGTGILFAKNRNRRRMRFSVPTRHITRHPPEGQLVVHVAPA